MLYWGRIGDDLFRCIEKVLVEVDFQGRGYSTYIVGSKRLRAETDQHSTHQQRVYDALYRGFEQHQQGRPGSSAEAIWVGVDADAATIYDQCIAPVQRLHLACNNQCKVPRFRLRNSLGTPIRYPDVKVE